jgi:branched-chain amino acid transport system permease protein
MLKFSYLLVTGIMIGGVYALVALGMVFIYKSSRIINFAQGNIMLLSAYICWSFMVFFGLPIWLSLGITAAISISIALFIERLTLRPLIGQPILSTMFMTLGLGIFLNGITILIWGGELYALPIISKIPVSFFGITISRGYIISFGLSTLLFVAFVLFFKFTRTGIAMRSVADDHEAALSQGISVKKVFSYSWSMNAIVASTGGICLATIHMVNQDIAATGIAKALPVILLGGLESFWGAFVGGIIIGVAELLVSGYLDPIVGGGSREVIPFAMLLIILLLKPYGLFGLKRIERV